MDVDNENFYDEIASFMPQPGDYSLEDLDEIIRSTDSHLDASLDINAFASAFNQNDFEMSIADSNGLAITEKNTFEQMSPSQHSQQYPQQFFGDESQRNFENDSHFSFSAFLSPTTSQQSAGYSSPFETPARRSSPSTSSIDDDHFNPDDFINFLNDDNAKIDDLTHDTIMKINENCRNTPSPTGSCTSSSGSSTSGVQSDTSSVSSMSQNYNCNLNQERDDLLEFIKFKNEKSESDIKMNEYYEPAAPERQFDNDSFETITIKEEEMPITTSTPTATTTFLPITLPVMPVTTLQTVPPANFVQGTIIPVQTVPLTTTSNSIVNIKTPTAIKIENKSSSENKSVGINSVKLATPTTNNVTTGGNSKVTPPPNAKPKTIFLSSNDFKALMQKMNTNGKKITGANGQMPKIIMKTANGKVITANKLTNNPSGNTSSPPSPVSIKNITSTATSTSSSQSLQFASKPNKASGPMVVRQQPSKVVTMSVRSAAAMAVARATLQHTKGRTDLAMLKGINDEKLFKKQLRMLKNRESASLSRKKKKEYVERLEHRISDLEKENYSLKGENSSLRSQLMAFAQTCNCKHGNVSEFILNTLNLDVKNGGTAIDTSYLIKNAKQHLDNCGNVLNNNNCGGTTRSSITTHHVKIAPKPANSNAFVNKGFKQRLNATTVKKNVAVLFAMAFMVTLNVGNFQNYLNKSTLENAIESSVTGSNEEPAVHTGRHLLWVPNEHEFHEKTNRSKRETEMANMPPPPLHFLRPVNRTTGDKINGTSAKDEPPIQRSSTIPATTTYANATQENMRLARNLHKWIGGNDYLNLTGNAIGNDLEHMEQFKFGSGSSFIDYDLPLQAPIGAKQKRKIYLDSETHQKHTKLNIGEGEHNSLDLFKPRISEEYLRLFRGIKRQDDTFYVLSFNMEHILLPASVYNKSSRPKMSLMLPAGDPSNNGDIILMQIDCEVINTTELEIKSHMIPEKLRPTKYSSNVRVNPNDVANNETTVPGSVTATKSNKIPLRREESKEKPSAPRTYFMMGPKNQASSQLNNSTTSGSGANIVKRKPTIVKLNANDSVIGSGVLNVRNSTLFSRMRDTVGSQNNGFLAASDVRKLI